MNFQGTLNIIYTYLNKGIPFFLGIFIFFVPIPHTTAVKEIAFYSALLFTLILALSRKIDLKLSQPFGIPFLLFTTWSCIGLFFALDKPNSIHDFVFLLLKYIILFYLICNFFRTKRDFEILSWVVFISASLFAIGGTIYFYYLLGNNILTTRIDFIGMEINIIGFVTIIGMILGVSVYSRDFNIFTKSFIVLSVIAMLTVTLLTQSRGSLLGLAVPLLMMFVKYKKLAMISLVLVISLALFLPVKNRLTPHAIEYKLRGDDRVKIWNTYLGAIKDHPFVGIGFGMEFWQNEHLWEKYSSKLQPEQRTIMQDAHNIFVSTTLRTGLIGLLLYLLVVGRFFQIAWDLFKKGNPYIKDKSFFLTVCFLSYLVKGMFEPALAHVPGQIAFIIMGMMAVLWNLNSEQEAES